MPPEPRTGKGDHCIEPMATQGQDMDRRGRLTGVCSRKSARRAITNHSAGSGIVGQGRRHGIDAVADAGSAKMRIAVQRRERAAASGAVAVVVQAFHQAAQVHRCSAARKVVGSLPPGGAWAKVFHAERAGGCNRSGVGGGHQRCTVPCGRAGGRAVGDGQGGAGSGGW